MKKQKRRVIGFALKLTVQIVLLLTVSAFIFGVLVVGQQSRRSLADGLGKRSRLLIGTIAAKAEAELRKGTANGGDIGISSVPDTINQMAEARFTTITGPADPLRFPNTSKRDFVWASNADPWKTRRATGFFQVAADQEKDSVAVAVVAELQKGINDTALRSLTAELGDWHKARERYQELNAQRVRSAQQQVEYAEILRNLPRKIAHIDSVLNTLPGNDTYSEPPLDTHKPLAPHYLFYKPIVYFVPLDNSFYQGLVRLEVSTGTITRQISDVWKRLIAVMAFTIIMGILGSIIVARITVKPIRRLASGVAVIRDTADKEMLKDHSIRVGTRDEIGWLTEMVNEMTQGLVKAAAANKELLLRSRRAETVPPPSEGQSRRRGQHSGRGERPAGDLRLLQGRKWPFRRLFRFQEAGRYTLRHDRMRHFGKGSFSRADHGGGRDTFQELFPRLAQTKGEHPPFQGPAGASACPEGA